MVTAIIKKDQRTRTVEGDAVITIALTEVTESERRDNKYNRDHEKQTDGRCDRRCNGQNIKRDCRRFRYLGNSIVRNFLRTVF